MKKNAKVLILEIIVIVLAIIGITFALTYVMNSIGITATSANLAVTYTGSTTLPSSNLSPISDSNATYDTSNTNIMKVNFTIKGAAGNPSGKAIIYDIVLEDLDLSCYMKNEYLKWKLFKNGSLLTSGNFSPTFDVMNNNELYLTTIQQDLPSSSASADSYQLLIWISEACTGGIATCTESQNQSNMTGETISGKVQARLYTDSKKALTRTTGSALNCGIKNLSERIISLAGNCTSWSSGFSGICKTNDHEYRYIGTNVNNWVRFNNDDYRIIGVFDDNSHGVTGKWLVKLIADDPLGGYSRGATNTASAYTTYSTHNNNWETSNVNILLNEHFLNATNTSSTYKSCSDWTYYYSDNAYKTKSCSDVIGYGIQTANLRNYIQPATWYLKGYNSNSYSKQNFYTCERSDATTITNCNSGNSGAYATKVENKNIGLMYISDYLYASGYYSNADTTVASSYYHGQQNWLYKGYEWTITPQGSASNRAFMIYAGLVADYSTHLPFSVRPAFYLKSTIKVKSGNGTIADPYIIY